MDEWIYDKIRKEYTLKVSLKKEDYIMGIADEEGWSIIVNLGCNQSTFTNCEKESLEKIKEKAYNLIIKIKEKPKKYFPQIS